MSCGSLKLRAGFFEPHWILPKNRNPSRPLDESGFTIWKSAWAPSRPPAAAIGPYLAACGRSPEPRTAGLGPSGYGQPGADYDVTMHKNPSLWPTRQAAIAIRPLDGERPAAVERGRGRRRLS